MSRAFKLSLAALLVAGALPAAAASHQITERIASFEDVVEAPAIVLSGSTEAPAQLTEQVTSFEVLASAPAFALSGPAAGSQQVTELVASFEAPVTAPVTATTPAAAQAAAARQDLRTACTCGHHG